MEKINWETVNQYSQLKTKEGDNLYLKLLNSYSQHILTDISELKDFANLGKFDELASLAHKLKSSSGNLGFTSVQAHLNDLEEGIVVKNSGCKESILLTLDYILADLNFVINKVKAELE